MNKIILSKWAKGRNVLSFNHFGFILCYFTSCDKGVAALSQDLHKVVCEIPTSQIQTHDGMRQSVTLIDGYIVGHTVTRVQHDTWEQKQKSYGEADRFLPDACDESHEKAQSANSHCFFLMSTFVFFTGRLKRQFFYVSFLSQKSTRNYTKWKKAA